MDVSAAISICTNTTTATTPFETLSYRSTLPKMLTSTTSGGAVDESVYVVGHLP